MGRNILYNAIILGMGPAVRHFVESLQELQIKSGWVVEKYMSLKLNIY